MIWNLKKIKTLNLKNLKCMSTQNELDIGMHRESWKHKEKQSELQNWGIISMQKVESDKKNSQHSSTAFHVEQDGSMKALLKCCELEETEEKLACANEALKWRWGDVSWRKRVSTLGLQSWSFFEPMRNSIWSKEKRGRLSCSPLSAASMNTARLSCTRTMRYSPIRSWASKWSGASTLPRCCCAWYVACHAMRLSCCNLRQWQHSQFTSQRNCRLTSEFFIPGCSCSGPFFGTALRALKKRKQRSTALPQPQGRNGDPRRRRLQEAGESCSATFTKKQQSAATVKSFTSHPLVCCAVSVAETHKSPKSAEIVSLCTRFFLWPMFSCILLRAALPRVWSKQRLSLHTGRSYCHERRHILHCRQLLQHVFRRQWAFSERAEHVGHWLRVKPTADNERLESHNCCINSSLAFEFTCFLRSSSCWKIKN